MWKTQSTFNSVLLGHRLLCGAVTWELLPQETAVWEPRMTGGGTWYLNAGHFNEKRFLKVLISTFTSICYFYIKTVTSIDFSYPISDASTRPLRHVILSNIVEVSFIFHSYSNIQRITKVSPFWSPPIRIIAFNMFRCWCSPLLKSKYGFNSLVISRRFFTWLLHVNLFMKINVYNFCLMKFEKSASKSSFSNNTKLTPKPVLLNPFNTVMRKWEYCNPAHCDVSAALPNLVVCLLFREEIWVNLWTDWSSCSIFRSNKH